MHYKLKRELNPPFIKEFNRMRLSDYSWNKKYRFGFEEPPFYIVNNYNRMSRWTMIMNKRQFDRWMIQGLCYDKWYGSYKEIYFKRKNKGSFIK